MHPAVDDLAPHPSGLPEQDWRQLTRGYRLAGLVTGAHRLGLLRRLAERGSASTATLADDLVAAADVVEWLCRGLAGAGLVDALPSAWRLSPQGAALAASPGAAAELDAIADDYDRFGRLDACARRLAAGERPPAPEPDSTGAARRAALREAVRHAEEHEALLARLWPRRPVRVLDVGGADGAFSRRLVRRWPEAEAVVVEQPAMAAVAQQACRGWDRVSVRAGDYLDGAEPDPLPSGADVVVLNHVLQGLPTSDQRRLVCRAGRALTPGGCIVSTELALSVDGGGPLEVVLWALGQAARGSLGGVLTEREQETLLRAAGLAAVGAWQVLDTSHAVLGVRPDAGAVAALGLRSGPQDPLDGEKRDANSLRALRSVS